MHLLKHARHTLPLLSLAFLCPKEVIGNEIKISNENNFIEFTNNVNNGANYSGTTVYLDSDLSLSGKSLEPIGNSSSYYFRGVFNGQGHIINDFKMNTSSSEYTGLFGISTGLTIRNVVLDFSCTVTSSYSGSKPVRAGGIIGFCNANSKQCVIENSVNMADVTFNGDTASSGKLHLGGVAGYLSSSGYPSYVKNCANYGSVTYTGTSGYPHIGGIVGGLSSSSSKYKYNYLYNCLNYGTITHNGTTVNTLYTGGILGCSEYAYIENCVSAGSISAQNTPPKELHC